MEFSVHRNLPPLPVFNGLPLTGFNIGVHLDRLVFTFSRRPVFLFFFFFNLI